jgi:hypothetical protein
MPLELEWMAGPEGELRRVLVETNADLGRLLDQLER